MAQTPETKLQGARAGLLERKAKLDAEVTATLKEIAKIDRMLAIAAEGEEATA